MQEHALIRLLQQPYTFDLHRAMQLVKHEAAVLGQKADSIIFGQSATGLSTGRYC